VLGALALASLTAAMLAAPLGENAIFYFVQYRAWELLLGALVALGAVPAIGGKRAAAAIAIGGLLLIAGGLVQAHRLTILGSAALLPCIGTAAVLHAGSRGGSLPSRLLGLPPFRFIGLISYSLYLWHWPLLVFYRLHGEPGRLESAALIAASIGLATLSWRFVEQPFRTRPYRLGTAATLIAGAGAIAGTALLGLAAAPIAARIHPTDARTAHILATSLHLPSDWRSGTCFVRSGRTSAAFDSARCLPISPTRPNVLIVGDSHAAHFVSGFMAAYPGVNFQQATSWGCRPLLHPTGRPWCVDLMRRTFGAFVDRPRLDAVILSARWRLTDVPRVAETIAAIGHRVPHIYVLGPIVEYNAGLPRILAAAPRGREEEDAARHRLTEQRAIDRALAFAVAGTGAVYVSTYRTICPPAAPCRLWSSPGTPLQFDYGHLTVEGATVIARAFAPALDFARTGTDKAAIRTAGPDLSIQTATNPH
jgi:hypothetical protein